MLAARANRTRQTEKAPSVLVHGPTFFATEDRINASRRRRGHAFTSDSSVSEQRLSFIHRGPVGPANQQKHWLSMAYAERPFRRAKLTACRKKFAFLSAWWGEVKAGCSKIAASEMPSPTSLARE
jgi:hypothetical protein